MAAKPENNVDRAEQAPLRDHLAALPGGDWALWRWVAVRGAGFPAAQMLSLASDEVVEAAGNLIQAQDNMQGAPGFGSATSADAIRAAQTDCDAARANYCKRFEDTLAVASLALYNAASTPLIQEAVIWQNRHAFDIAI